MSVRATLVAVVAALLLATPVLAQDEDEYPVDPTLTGPYVGGSVGLAWDDFSRPGDFGSSALSSVILGYRGSEYISIEGEFESLSGFQLGQEEIDGWLTSLGLRVHFPIGRIEPYFTYGVGLLHLEGRGATLGHIDNTEFAAVGGGGLAYQWNDSLSVFTEGIYTWPVSGIKGFDSGSLRFGLLYKFAD